MRLIVCLDDDSGMLFHKRRQSQDRVLRRRILALTAGKRLWMTPYSAKQFQNEAAELHADDSFLSEAAKGDYCFVEDVDIAPYENLIETIIVYRWNRKYPSDMKFPIDLTKHWRLIQSTDFVGSSHEKLTEEVYEK